MRSQEELLSALHEMTGAVRTNVSLQKLTHVRLGGPAACLVEPFGERDVATVVRACRDHDATLRVLGGGSNLVIADEGVDGVVMSLGSLNRIVRDENRLMAGAGVSLPTLLRGARELGLGGLEQLSGIPAVVGGAVAMNAGTHYGDTFEHLVSLTVVDRDGELRVLGPDAFRSGYRDGGLGDQIVVHATFELQPASPKKIFDRFEAYLKARNATQPVTEHSVGCVFTNPEGESAGRLIETAGCKLMQRGGVSVSGKHANYFVNDGQGTTAQFVELVHAVREKVLDAHGIELVPEVKFWGFDPEAYPLRA